MSAILPIVIFIVVIIALNIFQFGRPDQRLFGLVRALHPIDDGGGGDDPSNTRDQIIEKLDKAVFRHAGGHGDRHHNHCVKYNQGEHQHQPDELADADRQPRLVEFLGRCFRHDDDDVA